MLLRTLLVVNVWEHLFNSRVVRWLNYHHWGVFNTSMPLVMIFQKDSIMTVLRAILFQTLSHIEGLLSINGDSCWCIRLDICHIKPSTIGWLTALIIHSNSTNLCWVVHLVNGHCNWLSIAFIGFYKADVEIILNVITWDWVCCWPNSLHWLLQLLSLSSYRIRSFSINSFDLFNLLRLLWSTEIYFTISRLWRSLWSCPVEKPTSYHSCLVHY